MQRLRAFALALIASVASGVSAAAAQDADTRSISIVDQAAANASTFDFSFNSPESPALPLVGVSNDQITHIDSAQRFGLSVLSGIGDSEAGAALAFDFSPYWLSGQHATLEQYRQFNPWRLAIARSKASLAYGEGNATSGTPSSFVLSVAVPFFRNRDPMLVQDANGYIFENCLHRDMSPIISELRTAIDERTGVPRAEEAAQAFRTARDALMPAYNQRIEQAHERCATAATEASQRAQALDVGVALRFAGEPEGTSDFDNSGAMLWFTYRTPAIGGPIGQAAADMGAGHISIAAHGRYTWDDAQFDEDGTRLGDADVGLAAVAVEGESERFKWSLQAGWNRDEGISGVRPAQEYYRYVLHAEHELQRGVWLTASYGRAEGREGFEDDSYATMGISFNAQSGSGNFLSAIADALERDRR